MDLSQQLNLALKCFPEHSQIQKSSKWVVCHRAAPCRATLRHDATQLQRTAGGAVALLKSSWRIRDVLMHMQLGLPMYFEGASESLQKLTCWVHEEGEEVVSQVCCFAQQHGQDHGVC